MPDGNVYVPLKWQVEPWNDMSPIMLLTGAAGGGKSRVAAEKFHALHLRYPGATGVIGRKDKTAANRSVVPFLLHTVMGDTDWGVFRKSEQMFDYKNGSQVWVIGMRDENQREGLRSIGKDGSVDFVWFEEANKFTFADHQEITTRMRGNAAPFRQIIYSTNPDGPDHWIKRTLIDGKQASVYYSRPEDNPSNPESYIEALKGLTGVYRERMWLGRWVQAEGVIYTEYDSSIHLLDNVKPQRKADFEYYVSVDFGYTSPFSASLWEVSPSRVMKQVWQIYRTQRLVEDHARDIRRMLGPIVPNAIICDHDAEDRATLERHLGMKTVAAYKPITTGIEAVKARFRDRTIFLNRNAVWRTDEKLEAAYLPTTTYEELGGYAWSDKKQDMPNGEHDHGCDEMRYAVAHIDNIAERTTSILTETTTGNYLDGSRNDDRLVFI